MASTGTEGRFTASYRHHHRISILRRFGWYAALSLVGGTIIIFGFIAFICFLWLEDNGNRIWTRIVVNGWVPRAVTISALILRWAITAQAVVCTAMIAALYLSAFATPLASAPAMSIFRFSNNGPLSIFPYLPRELGGGLFLWLLIVLLTAVTSLLQSTSTLLLSDIGEGTISERRRIDALPFGINSSGLIPDMVDGTSAVGIRTSTFPTYIDYSEAAEAFDPRIDDTGVSIRGFLPFASEESRARLTTFLGNATIMDTRVVCMRPEISNLKVEAVHFNPTMEGNISTTVLPPRFNRASTISEYFSCSWAIPGAIDDRPETLREWPLALCSIKGSNVDSISFMEPLTVTPITSLATSIALLLINATGTRDEWMKVSYSEDSVIEMTNIAANGVWLRLGNPSMKVSLGVTLCYYNPAIQDHYVEAWREPGVRKEPVFEWNAETGTYDTSSIQSHFAATSSPLAAIKRSVLNLRKEQPWELMAYHDTGRLVDWNSTTKPKTLTGFAFGGLSNYEFGASTLLCSYCEPRDMVKTNRLHSTVFNNIIQDTGRPALALQAFFTTLWGISYYNFQFQFDVSAPVDIEYNVVAIRPTDRHFFYAIMGALTFHLALVLVITVMFILAPGNNLLGNAWSAIAQVQGTNTQPWLAIASGITDSTIKNEIESSSENIGLVGIGKADKGIRRRSIP